MIPEHSEGLATASLPISKESRVISFEEVINEMASSLSEYLNLR